MRIIDLVEDILSNAATSVRVMDCVGRIGHKETDGPVSVAMESVIVTRDHVMEFQGPVETVSKKQNVLHLKQRPPVLTPVAGKRVGCIGRLRRVSRGCGGMQSVHLSDGVDGVTVEFQQNVGIVISIKSALKSNIYIIVYILI